ncbi:unnamed protein product [Rhizophagus irregularis]|nr:unnamed protein product [Rhizophagus irregularis]CAB5394080.1 unnamed protein product [Rhizophagus irregularis]CAB5395530.1 unnamed protein product [Rhizophagus irregularis]
MTSLFVDESYCVVYHITTPSLVHNSWGYQFNVPQFPFFTPNQIYFMVTDLFAILTFINHNSILIFSLKLTTSEALVSYTI